MPRVSKRRIACCASIDVHWKRERVNDSVAAMPAQPPALVRTPESEVEMDCADLESRRLRGFELGSIHARLDSMEATLQRIETAVANIADKLLADLTAKFTVVLEKQLSPLIAAQQPAQQPTPSPSVAAGTLSTTGV